MSLIRVCNACRGRIAEDDRGAIRDLPMYNTMTGEPLEPHDYCGGCVVIIRTELPRLAAEARMARRAALAPPAESVRHRALKIWKPGERISLAQLNEPRRPDHTLTDRRAP